MSANTFSIESNSKATEDVGKLNTTLSYGSRWKTQHNALYESRWKTQHNALYESRCGAGTSFTEDLS